MTTHENYAASIAHEIKQPLASIVTNVDAALRWLDRGQPDIANAMESLQRVHASAFRAAAIVDSLRSLIGHAPLSLLSLRIEEIVEETMRLASDDFRARGVVVTLQFSREEHRVLADPVQLQGVIFNLITNALHAMAEAAPADRHIRIETTGSDDGFVHLRISDSGCGMPDSILSRIFEPFFTTKDIGMGIGLAICRSIIERHGGTIDASSSVGQGSTFCLRLPVIGRSAAPNERTRMAFMTGTVMKKTAGHLLDSFQKARFARAE